MNQKTNARIHLIGQVLMLCALALVCPGCVIREGDFTVLSSRLVETREFELSKADRQRVVGEDTTSIICFIPTGGPPTLDAAIDAALDAGGGDVMTDVVVRRWFWYIPLIYGQAGWSVEGDVVKTRKR